MNARTILVIIAAAFVFGGCDTIKDRVSSLLGKKDQAQPASSEQTTPATPQQGTPQEPAVDQPPVVMQQPTVAQTPPQRQLQAQEPEPVVWEPRVDEPFFTSDTGTVDPGMLASEVTAIWGPPVTRREDGEFTYLYFRNGCEWSCGKYDLVVLQNGQVTDAVVRFAGHHYSGLSSSPPDRVPQFTPPMRARPTPPDSGAAPPQ